MLTGLEEDSFLDSSLSKKVSPETFDSILEARRESYGPRVIICGVVLIIALLIFLL